MHADHPEDFGLMQSPGSSQAIPEQTASTAAHVPLAAIVNISTATHFALVSPMVAVQGRDGAHTVANSHQMQ